MFQLKSFPAIVQSMVNYAKAVQKKVTDFSVGSVARTMLDAPAIEIDELYQQMFLGLQEAIPVAVYNSFGFSRLDATPATGVIRVTITSSANDTVVGAATVFTAGAVGFKPVTDAVISAGSTYADIRVSALVAGVTSNVASGTVFTTNPAIDGFLSAVALGNFALGTDKETDDDMKSRFIRYVSTLNRGTESALKYGASLAAVKDANGNIVERAIYTVVVVPWLTDPNQPPALVNVYVHNGTTGASAELVADVQKIIYGYYEPDGTPVAGWSAAGVKVDVYAATSVAVNVTGTVVIASGYASASVISNCEAAVAAYINALPIGAAVLRAEIIAAVMGVSGVVNFTLSAPASDVSMTATNKAIAGTLGIAA